MELSHSSEATSQMTTQEFPNFYTTRRFITVWTRTLLWSLSRARRIQSIPSNPVFLRFIFSLLSLFWKNTRRLMSPPICSCVCLTGWSPIQGILPAVHKQDPETGRREVFGRINLLYHTGRRMLIRLNCSSIGAVKSYCITGEIFLTVFQRVSKSGYQNNHCNMIIMSMIRIII